MEKFRKSSGFTLNYDKTVIFRIGSARNSEDVLITQRVVSWTNEPINVLGVYISTDESQLEQLNYESTLKKLKLTLSKWSTRKSSLFGRVLIINMLIVSLFVYKMQVLPRMSNKLIETIKKEITQFIWNNSRPKISYDFMIMDRHNGGAGLVDIVAKDKSLKIAWIGILKNEPELNRIVQINTLPEIREMIWECNLSPFDVKFFIKDRFWRDVFEAWFEFKEKEDTISNDMSQIIWLNSKIRILNMPLYWRKAISKGLIFVKQLVNKKGWITQEDAMNSFSLSVMSYNALKTVFAKRTSETT